MKKIIFKTITFFIIQVMLIPNIALGTNTSAKSTLSPVLQISSNDFNSIINSAALKYSDKKISALSFDNLAALTLNQLTQTIIYQCQKGNYTLLTIDWDKQKTDYQQFIKEAAAVNSAIKKMINFDGNKKPKFNEFKNSIEFLKTAINTRINIIENYQAPLSEKGLKETQEYKKQTNDLNKSEVSEKFYLYILERLLNPPHNWFIVLYDQNRTKVINNIIFNKGLLPRLIPTWGCSTQCDHCDGASLIKVTCFPWAWIEDAEFFSYAPIMIDETTNDYLRDYYDLVFDRDGADIYKIFLPKYLYTSGFEAGSVGEKALNKILDPKFYKSSKWKKVFKESEFKISIAPSAWMRKIGVEQYSKAINNILNIFEKSKTKKFEYLLYNLERKTDPDYFYEQLIRKAKIDLRAKKSSKNPDLKFRKMNLADLDLMTIFASGRVKQLSSEKEFKSANHTITNNTTFANEDIGRFFLLADGSIVKGLPPTKKHLLRRYKHVRGLEPIGQETISCYYCDLLCNGKIDVKCIGRIQLFNRWGLTHTGGFRAQDFYINHSI